MYKVNNLKLNIDFDKNVLKKIVSKKLGIGIQDINSAFLAKLSIDARNKSNIVYVASIVFDTKTKLNLNKFKSVEKYVAPPKIEFKINNSQVPNIVIVGSGPSGLFAGLTLAESGAKVTILERGYEMSERKKAIANLLEKGILDTQSNIQFGEGGAGTFSDGKLNSGIKSEYINFVLETFYKYGADESILYQSRAHIGTDVLEKVIVNMRQHLIALGSQILFKHQVVDVNIKDNAVKSVVVQTPDGTKVIDCDILIMGIGHSSRDTIRMLAKKNLALKTKPFSMGYRIEHLQKDINVAQYGEVAQKNILPPADYHLSVHLNNGRSVYTFCMCPGGVVVPAMSEKNTIVTNGMSYSDRAGINSNSAILCTIEPQDFPSDDVLSGIELQEKYERLAYLKAGGYMALVQKVGDYLKGTPTKNLGKVIPTFKPAIKLGSVEDLLPKFAVDSIKQGIVELDKKLHGFADPDATLTGVETRSSAPYQVVRNLDMTCNISRLYMIGEGAGFAGGIMSSAVEGIKCAKNIIDLINQSYFGWLDVQDGIEYS